MTALRAALAFLVRNRLVHFFVIGAAVWAVAPADEDGRTLRIGREEVLAALARAQATAGRALGPDERRATVADLVRERVLAAEARRLGVGLEDDLVRARLADRMRGVLAAGAAPREEDVREEAATLATRAPARVDLEVVFVAGGRPGAAALAEAIASARTRGEAGPTGDTPPIAPRAEWTVADLARLAGPGVARHAEDGAVGAWSPPIASAWGFWIVRVAARRAPTASELHAEAREAATARHARAATLEAVARAAATYRIDVATPEGLPRFHPSDLTPPRASREID